MGGRRQGGPGAPQRAEADGGGRSMEESFSDRLGRGSWVAPVAELVGAFPVSFGSTCQVLREEAAQGR